jgi:hypothetical protein
MSQTHFQRRLTLTYSLYEFIRHHNFRGRLDIPVSLYHPFVLVGVLPEEGSPPSFFNPGLFYAPIKRRRGAINPLTATMNTPVSNRFNASDNTATVNIGPPKP